jgi:hypothetical protein
LRTYAFYLAVIVLVTATLGIPTFADYSYNQTSNTQAQIGTNVGSGDSTDTFSVTNSTGTTWTDYALVVGAPLATAGSPNESYFTSCSGTLSLGTSPGNSSPNTGIYVNECEINGISIATGSTYTFTVGIGAGEPGWEVSGTPSVSSSGTGPGPGGTSGVPEPGSMLLLSSGLIGIAGLRRKFNA